MIVNIAVVSSVTSDLTKLVLLKGNEALEKILFFFSKARKYGEEIKIKKINKNSFISGLKNDFLEVKQQSSMVENGVFRDIINTVNN